MRFFKPAWMNGYKKDKALKEVEKETDQAKLTEIAIKAAHPVVKNAAAEKLTDQSFLLEAAVRSINYGGNPIAVGKLTDN